MHLIKPLLIFFAILLTGCSYTVPLKYTGNPEIQTDVTPSIGKIIIVDNRSKESDVLGSARGLLGIKLKTLRTDGPIDKVVEGMYRQALKKMGFFNGKENNLLIFKGEINKLYCHYKLNYKAGVVINVSLIDSQTDKTIFQSPYRSEGDEWSIQVVILSPAFAFFASVETLRDLTEKALNNTVKETITDPEFIKALNYTRVEATEEGNTK